MPLRPGLQTQRATLAWVEGLLPSSWEVRSRLAEAGGVKLTNPVALLGTVGLDCPGAVQVCEERAATEITEQQGSLEPVDDGWIEGRLEALAEDASSWYLADERWSLGGGQAKFPLYRSADGAWSRAHGSQPTTHIFKPGVRGVRLLALNEHICLSALGKVGLLVARTEYLRFGALSATVVERFDRHRQQDGTVVREHQEDCCQALGSTVAYETSGGPSATQICDVLRTEAVDDSGKRFAEALVAGYLLGATDGHARNYSIKLWPGGTRLAPLYDVASALPYERDPFNPLASRKIAMAICGERVIGAVTSAHWEKWAKLNRIDPAWLMDRIHVLATTLPAAIEDSFAQLDSDDDTLSLRSRLLPAIEKNCARALSV
jgi:serine/threonine-protein kinase HipA